MPSYQYLKNYNNEEKLATLKIRKFFKYQMMNNVDMRDETRAVVDLQEGSQQQFKQPRRLTKHLRSNIDSFLEKNPTMNT